MIINRIKSVLIAMLVFCAALSAQDIPSPEQHFGFQMGADRQLVDWNQLHSYFLLLDQASERVSVIESGKSTLGKPFIYAVISSEENLKKLETYQDIQKQIARPYGLDEKAARALAAKGKAVVLVSMNIHSTEIGSSQASAELAWDMAVRNDPDINKILDNVIVILFPSLNPDGLQIVVDWYRQHVGTEYEGSSLPWLYHHYAGHAINRDWFMFNLQESRLTSKVLYHEWFPQIVLDQHQMGSSGPRLYLPPYSDPVSLNVRPELMTEVNRLGNHVTADMHQQGFTGITSGMGFNAHFPGTMSKTPLLHNMVGILTEMASVRIASPVFLPRGSTGSWGPERLKHNQRADHSDPWPGGWWRLRNIVEYELAMTYSVLDLAATYREQYLFNFYSMNKRSIEQGKSEAPFAYIIPLDQHDPGSASEMLKRLEYSGVEILRAREKFVCEGKTYPEGTFIISAAQACRPFIKEMMDRQDYPNLKEFPGGPPLRPYDFSGWTLPLQMGVEVIEADMPVNIKTEKTADYCFAGEVEFDLSAELFVLDRRDNYAYAVINGLLKTNVPVYSSNHEIKTAACVLPPGAFIIPNQRKVSENLQKLIIDHPVKVYKTENDAALEKSRINPPRLAIYQPWTASIDEGWTRLTLDMFNFEYTVLHNKDIKGGRALEKTDALIIPGMTAGSIINGRTDRNIAGAPKTPEAYAGGIGKEGVKAIQRFVENGGTLLCIGASTEFAISEFGLPARNIVQNMDRKAFFIPGSLLELTIDTSHPLAYGMPAKTAARFAYDPVFTLSVYPREVHAVGYYEDKNPLLSGWLIGDEIIAGQTALAEIPLGKGKVILYGFGVQGRAQTYGTFKLLFNGILNSRME